VVEAYETVVPEKSRRPAARSDEKCSAPSSRRDLHQFLYGKEFRRTAGQRSRQFQLVRVQFASIGPVTSATLRELHMPVAIEAREYTMGGLIRAIVLARYAEPSA
jgi:uroporphyrinogen-III synthase